MELSITARSRRFITGWSQHRRQAISRQSSIWSYRSKTPNKIWAGFPRVLILPVLCHFLKTLLDRCSQFWFARPLFSTVLSRSCLWDYTTTPPTNSLPCTALNLTHNTNHVRCPGMQGGIVILSISGLSLNGTKTRKKWLEKTWFFSVSWLSYFWVIYLNLKSEFLK